MVRAENAAAAIGTPRPISTVRAGAASLLLAAVVSALMVVANQVIDTWSPGHLLAAWMVLWVVAATLALLTLPAARGRGPARWRGLGLSAVAALPKT